MSSWNYNTTRRFPVRVGGRIVGEVIAGRFVKKVRGSRHMLREPKGWAVDVESLEDAESYGAESVEIHDIETGVTYSAPVALFLDNGCRLDRGHGVQICLPLRYWTRQRPGEAQQLAFALA